MTLLHAIVRHDPPIRLLSNMIQFYPAALEKQDCLGRTALHVAAGCGANVRTIKSLVVAYSNACTTQDVDVSGQRIFSSLLFYSSSFSNMNSTPYKHDAP